MDAETERLIARTRQRRELLNQKMGKTPEAAPRKRRTPLSEDLTSVNAAEEPQQENVDDSPKRQRMRENEQAIKPDTPAIPSVKSRLRDLASQHAQLSDTTSGEQEASTPVPTPRKSLSSPPLQRARPAQQENTQRGTMRKKRFADLANNINNWEDDLSHPTIVKEEEKKPRWQPPKATVPPASAQISSPKKTRAPLPPTGTATRSYSQTPTRMTSTSAGSQSVQNSSVRSSPSVSRKFSQNTPARSGSRVGFNSSPKPFQPYSESKARLTSVRSPATSRTNLTKQQEEVQNDAEMSQQDSLPGRITPKTAPKPPSKPLSACRAELDNKLSGPTNNISSMPSMGMASSTPVSQTRKQTCTPARRGNSPALDEDDVVRMRPKVRKSIDDEPTAHSVSARMSAWEQMSSAQVVSDIKKVKPGSATPVKTPSVSVPATGRTPVKTPSVSLPVTGRTPAKTPFRTTPVKSSAITPSKSFKDSIKERAAQVNPVTAAEAEDSPSPSKTKSLSPKKASSAMKAVQQQLVQQTQSTSMAERLRQERQAELQSIQERWKNGILNEEDPYDETPKPDSVSKRQGVREQARADFNKKLASIGLGTPADNKAKADEPRSGNATTSDTPKAEFSKSSTIPKPPPVPPPIPSSSGSMVTAKPPVPSTSLYKIVSQKKKGGVASPPKPLSAPSPSKTGRRVKFDDSFESEDSDASLPEKQDFEESAKTQTATGVEDDESESYTSEDSPTEDDADFEVVLRRPRPTNQQQGSKRSEDDDDLSLSAFVPASVRRQSVLPSPQQQHRKDSRRDTSADSSDREHNAARYTGNQRGGRSRMADTESSSSLTSQSSNSNSDRQEDAPRSGYCPDDTEESVDERDAIGDLLDEAMDSSESQDSPVPDKRHTPVMRKRSSHRKATEDGHMPFSVNEYRASRNMQVLEVKQSIVRNSQYCRMNVKEEQIDMPQMPTHPPTPAPRQSIQERVRELQELIQQEQSVIMQTSNALNQCCSSTSHFAGSSEQVECNRILLIACQKRQSYMMEIQRLRDTKVLDPSPPGPKGSLTISDIRLPLKKEFVTKIGTSHDTTTYYFILLLRNGPQIISTQMLSTHDPMMRGSLDFPNLIKINGITGSFKLQLEIYSMSVCREAVGKGKKKKTPKKGQTVQSPGGPVATRTTSFSQVTSVPLTMKSLDKHSFHLDRLSHLSPLHGMIYLNLKCLMEANVEERGFLTMFEDVSGFGSWHRRWCALSGNKLQYWKYPDDETRKDPMGYIDLKRCVTEKVGLISRDICARPHTFELMTVRQPRKGEKDTLVSRTYNTMTTVRHMLSADTKEERIVWCNKVNQALANIRTWHSDAMRPIRK